MEALVGALLSVLAALLIGLFIRFQIWGESNKPRTPIDHGRAWAAYVAFFSVLSCAYFFYHDSLRNAIATVLLNVFVFPLISFIGGLAYGYFKTREQSLPDHSPVAAQPDASPSRALVVAAPAQQTEELMWASALGEFESDKKRSGLWAKSFAQAEGNDAQAKAHYLKQRVAELQTEERERSALLQRQKVAQARALLESQGYAISASQGSQEDAPRAENPVALAAPPRQSQATEQPKRKQPALDASNQELAEALKFKVKEYANWRDAHRLALLLGYVVVILHSGVFKQASFEVFDNTHKKTKLAELASPEEFVTWTLETLC